MAREQKRAHQRGQLHDQLMLVSLIALTIAASLFAPTGKQLDVPTEPDLRAVAEAAVHQPADAGNDSATVDVTPDMTLVETALPDFAAISNVQEKKQAFFNFLLPKVREANNRIREERRFLLKLRDVARSSEPMSEPQLGRLAALADRYRVRDLTDRGDLIDSLLLRVDVVPESLVLAQAANESGWGTSRFARQANNLFGVWCFSQGCGLEPLQRDEGLTHEVARYDSIQSGIQAYLHTLNTNAAYVELRAIRADYRADANYVSGLAMAEGLLRYSARGADYVREIQAMIRVNNLQRFNQSA